MSFNSSILPNSHDGFLPHFEEKACGVISVTPLLHLWDVKNQVKAIFCRHRVFYITLSYSSRSNKRI